MPSELYFDPSLWLQRQSWVLTKLRLEQVDSVVDVGCANGTLLSTLMQPAFQTDVFPRVRFPLLELAQGAASGSEADKLLPPRHWTRAPADINLSRVAGLDIDAAALRNARSALSLHGQAIAESRPRWRSLEIKLFEGPLGSYNEDLATYDAFVATEVIEHLDESALEQFGPSVLGKYRPRILLVTTPNYCFNKHFGGDLSTRPGFPDPSGRTDRVFRHDDHKFEWTPDEFKRWAKALGEVHDYDVTIGGVGQGIYRRGKGEMLNGGGGTRRPRTGDDEDERLRYASQTAFFRRRDASPRLADDTGAGAEYFGVDSSLGHQGGSSVPPVPVAPSHDHCGEQAQETDEDDDDGDERGQGRRARSRRPDNLPFLSSPSPASSLVPSVAVRNVARVPMPATPAARDSSGSVSTHRVLWDERYPCWTAPATGQAQAVSASGRGLSGRLNEVGGRQQSTEVFSAEAIVAAVLEKQRQLFIAAQWSDYDEGGAKFSDESPVWEAKAKLLDIWYDDLVRGFCAGKITALLDALQLSPSLLSPGGEAPSGQATKMSLSGHPDAMVEVRRDEIVVGSNAAGWELRVIIDHHEHSEPADSNGNNSAADEAPAPIDSDLWLVHTKRDTVKVWCDKVQEAKRWIPQSYAQFWKRQGREVAPPALSASWD